MGELDVLGRDVDMNSTRIGLYGIGLGPMDTFTI